VPLLGCFFGSLIAVTDRNPFLDPWPLVVIPGKAGTHKSPDGYPVKKGMTGFKSNWPDNLNLLPGPRNLSPDTSYMDAKGRSSIKESYWIVEFKL